MHDKRRVSRHTTLALAAMAAIWAFGIFLFTHNEADVDLWGNVGFVRSLPGNPGFHLTNTFSFTEPDHPWVNHEWLAEYILNRAHHHFGNPGLLLLKLALGFALIGILYSGMRKSCRSGSVRVLYLAVVMSTLGYGFSTRPHLFTYVLFAALLSTLLRPSPRFILLPLAAPLGCLWANLHGAFFLGQILLLLAAAVAIIKRATGRETSSIPTLTLVLSSAAFFIGTLLTPYGIRLWDFVFESGAIMRPVLSEWAPIDPKSQFGIHIDFMALACITLFAVLASFRRTTAFGLLILTLALIAAIAMRRNIPLFAIAAALIATRHVDETIGWQIEDIVDKLPKGVVIALLGAGAAVSLLFVVRANRSEPLAVRIPRDQFPIEAVTFLERNGVEANALVFFDWAEYCIWKLHPRCRVFLDGRFRSAYSEKTINRYMNFIYAGPNALAALEEYPTDLVFVHVNNPCTALMRNLEGWELAYQDQMAAIFVKRPIHDEFLRHLAMKSGYIPDGLERDIFP
jgi:hypothetical protein